MYFAPSTGEFERLADILQEYRVPFQLGIRHQRNHHTRISPSACTSQASSPAPSSSKGRVRRGTFFSDSQVAIFGSEDLFDTSDIAAPGDMSRRNAAAF